MEDKKKLIGKALKKAGELLDDNPSEQVLLKEYEVCQSHVNSLGNQFWISISIFISVNAAILGGITYSLIAKNVTIPNNAQYNTQWLVLLIGLGMILISLLLRFWQRRITFQININNDRMHEIEPKLGMSRNQLIIDLDEYYEEKNRVSTNDLSKKLKEKYQYKQPWWWLGRRKNTLTVIPYSLLSFFDYLISQIPSRNKRFYAPPMGEPIMTLMFSLIIIMWIILIALSFTLFGH